MRKAIRATEKAISAAETAKMTADEALNLEMRKHLLRIAREYYEPGDKLKKIWGDLAFATGLTYGQCKRIWKQEWKIIPGSVVRKLDKLVADLERQSDAEQETNRKRYWHLTHTSSDPDFYQARTATNDTEADGLD